MGVATILTTAVHFDHNGLTAVVPDRQRFIEGANGTPHLTSSLGHVLPTGEGKEFLVGRPHSETGLASFRTPSQCPRRPRFVIGGFWGQDEDPAGGAPARRK